MQNTLETESTRTHQLLYKKAIQAKRGHLLLQYRWNNCYNSRSFFNFLHTVLLLHQQ
jgi:hypothetical protein